jgi:DNA-directed RNA polymerase specialized sigma24 family protein
MDKQTYSRADVEGIVRSYADTKHRRDDPSVHDCLIDFEKALMQLPYHLVSVLYEHGVKGEPVRVIEQRTGVNREDIRRRYFLGLEVLRRTMNDNSG